MHHAHSHQCFRTHFLAHYFHLEIGNAIATVIHVLIDTTFVRAATVATNDDAIVCSHTHRSMTGNTPTASEILETINITAIAFPSNENSSKQSSCGTIQLRSRESSVIRMRTMSSSVSVTALELFPWVFFSQCVAHGNAEFLEKTFLHTTILWLIGGPTHFSASFDVTSSSVHSFAVASSSIPVADFLFTYSCNPPVYPSSVVPCHSALLRVVHLTHLPFLDLNSRRL